MSLQECFDPRRNNLDAIRLVLALLVAVSHAIVMRTGDQPHWGTSTIGDVAVDGFFVLSGFLVARSWLSLRNVWRYVWHRALRILPAFWTCLVVLAAVVAPLASILEGRPLSELLTAAASAPRFVVANSGVLITQYDIASVFADNPEPLSLDGSLWTLALEVACYAVLAALGVTGALNRRPGVVPVIAAVLLVLLTMQSLGIGPARADSAVRMLMLFMVGASAYLYADRIPVNGWLALAAAALLLGSLAVLQDYRPLGALPLAYLLLWLAVALPQGLSLRADLSYGVYIYHWPLQQLLMVTALASLPLPAFVLVSLAGVIPLALASWYGIERRALRRKGAPLPSWLPGTGRRHGHPGLGTPSAQSRTGDTAAVAAAVEQRPPA